MNLKGANMRRHATLRFLALFSVIFLFSLVSLDRASAQVVSGSISGTVVDPSGAVIVGATVTAINTATNAKTIATTTSSGSFLVAGLAVGTYNLTFSKSGFQNSAQSGIEVTAAADHGLGSIKLTLGSAATTVEVSGAPPLLESTQAQISTAISNTQMTNFPGLNANSGLDNMAVYLPGINMSRDDSFSNENGIGFSSNGISSRMNDQQIDGQNNNDNSIGGPSVFIASPLFVQEYQVIQNNFGPEYGRNSGSVIDEVTKQGTNVWHGTILGTESNNYVDALSTTQKAFQLLDGPPRFNDEFTGGSIGGPIWKNHVFVFGGFDNEIVSSNTLAADGTLSPDTTGLGQLATCFPNSSAVQAFEKYSAFAIGTFNPQPVPGSIAIAGTGPTDTLPAISANGTTCPAVEFAEPERLGPDGSHEWDWDYRMDAVVSDTDRFFGRYLFQKLNDVDAFGDLAGGYPVNVPSLTQSILLDETHTFTSTMVNDFRVSFQRENVQFGGNPLGTVPQDGDLTNALASVSIQAAGFLGFGPSGAFPQGRIIGTWQGQDNWSYLQGKSEWTAGVNFTYQRSINDYFPGINGSFAYADWDAVAANTPAAVTVGSGTPILDFREHDLFLYAGDNYKLKSNLTLNLGLTWTYFGSPENLFHTLTEQNETGPNPFFNPALPLSVRTFPEIASQKNLFGPSAGFAWTPQGLGWLTGNGATVIRGGYRFTVDPSYYNIFVDMYTSTPMVLLNSFSGSSAAGIAIPADPTGSNVRAALASSLQLGLFDPRDFAQTTIPTDFGADKVQEWSFGIQRQVNPHLVVESRYVGNHGMGLYSDTNGNPYVAGLAASFPNLVPSGVTPCPASQAVVPNAIGRENCNEGILNEFQNNAYSDYDGWQNDVRTNQLFNQLTLQAGYTWSKSTNITDDVFSTFAGGNSDAFAQNPFDPIAGEHGISGLDFPQQFTVQGYWTVPGFRSQHGVVGHVLGGWNVGVAYQLVSGQPYTPSQILLNTFTGGTAYDFSFDTSGVGNGLDETARPFVGSSSAPADQVGIFAGDACALTSAFGAPLASACADAPGTLLSYNQLNPLNPKLVAPAATVVSNSQVRYIVNGAEADSIFGTPFGNVARGSARDFHTNVANISVIKAFKFSERVNLQARLDMLNAFNHPNFGSVGPFVDEAGVIAPGSGFANPTLFGSGPRVMKAGLQITF